MDTELTDAELKQKLDERFDELPPVLQKAVESADIQAHLRALSDEHKLHLDQWQLLEDNVMLTLFGFQNPENLAENFRKDLDIDEETANALATDVSDIVFKPIREELEKDLAFAVEAEDEDSGSVAATAAEHPLAAVVPAVAPVAPGTPPSPPPEGKAVRAPISESYNAGEASTVRKTTDGDPYREPAA